ncbi:hypothetical protein OF83DRAFT_1167959 [Amylostereum chailletii]|nr:hypothetical protein OF83DRAFT_1167959 [Amylostereum chailletii]
MAYRQGPGNQYGTLPRLSPPSAPHKVPKTLKQWINDAKETTDEVQKNGSTSPFAWVFVEGTDIPPNAIVGGDDRGRPLYIARAFYEGGLQLGKAGKHLKSGAAVFYHSREIDVPAYEVLVELNAPSRWVYQPSSGAVEMPVAVVAPRSQALLEQRFKEFKTVIIVDDSLSMEGQSWIDAREALAGVAEMTRNYGADGLDIYFLNDSRFRLDVKDRGTVQTLFGIVSPEGQTPTGKKLDELFNRYIPKLEDRNVQQKPISIIVITDGVPTDDPEEVIIKTARRLDDSGVPSRMLGIQFVQIGDDPNATDALRELDDDLAHKHGIRDMVDTTLFNPNDPLFGTETMVKILMGSMQHALDNEVGPPPV